MTKKKSPLFSFSATGSLADEITFQKRYNSTISRTKPSPEDAKSFSQLSWRHMYQKAVALWHLLSSAEQADWESQTRRKHMTGFAWFMSQALKPNPGLYLPLQGGIMQGDIDMATFRVLDLTDPLLDQEADTKKARTDDIIAKLVIHSALATVHQDAPALIAAHAALANVHHTPSVVYTEGARAYHTASQSIPNATFTTLSFNSERWDTDTIHDNVANNSRLTCKTSGKYVITSNVAFASNAQGDRGIRIKLNGTTVIAAGGIDSPAIIYAILVAATIYSLSVNDYVETVVWQNRGGALNILSESNFSPEFAMQRVG